MNETQEKIKNIEYLVRGNETVILNSGFEVTSLDHWTGAMNKVINNDAQILVGRSDGSLVRSTYLSFPKPLIAVMNRYVVPHSPKVNVDVGCIVSKKTILTRDNYKCYYCGARGNTVDHVIPRSKGGKSTWENLIASCFPCNSFKADKSIADLGLEDPIIPEMEPGRRHRLVPVEKAVRDYIETAYMTGAQSEDNLVTA